ncbi:MAG: Dihydrodipicolinate synthase [Candidatus Kaiserbacteria bacterium GW2011_GWA2_49_19]|uniref:4-hydroxy-tetrahydrodipicolinate synthase n=2 Tax=Candidatus Kaiseribacteriota TaxID=1752734 RepID=A0A0G1VSX3_9BACT|nr:MAG: Dihydrodipicolinate synthase [Candidatus Kaiserbacteria bacterium GW2011_GWA2_49_19]OGG60722.1 MAG: 4-hydroxy-tetrahydrodipicolinate synthase [Candidatus Kaiserbacteria bacterium RIFCSPHIGHO2_02_FULL_49_16]
MAKLVLQGALTAIVTPFTKKGAVDFLAFRRLIRRQLDAGINGIVPCGSTGEAVTLNDKEYASVIKCAVKEIGGYVPVIAGAGSNNTARAIALSKIAQAQGVDGLLHVTPFYNKPTPNGLVAHYRAIVEAVNLPIILYNVPSRTGSNVLPNTIIRISKEVPGVVAVKEASGNIDQVRDIIKGARKGFITLSGDDAITFSAMKIGARGCISVVANEVPREFGELCQEALAGNWKKAREIHLRLLPLMDINFIESNPIPVKTALSMMGLIEESFRLPLVQMEKQNKPKLKRCLKTLGLI